MKIKKFAEILMIITFIAFLGAGMYFTLANRDAEYSYYENRNYAMMPEASVETVLNGDYLDGIEDFLSDHSAFRENLVKIQTYIDANILKRPVINDVVVTDEVLLPYKPYEIIDEEKIKNSAEKVASLNNEVKELVDSYGGEYVFTAVPCQYACYEDAYPFYLNNREEYTDLSIKYLSEAMAKYGVNFIDMLPIFENSEDPVESARDEEGLFYSSRIDNHYDVRGGYLTYKAIVDLVNDKTDFNLKFPEGDEIIFTQYENPYRGSRTRKLLDVINFEEYIYRADFSEQLNLKMYSGIYEATLRIYEEGIHLVDGMITYGYYMGGDKPQSKLSTNRPELPSVLIYGDSYTNAVEVMAYYSFSEMHSLDLRHYKEMRLQDYIKEFEPDVVVCIRDYEALLTTVGNGDIGAIPDAA